MSKDDSWDPRWYYEMGRMDAEHLHKTQQKSTPAQKAVLWICLAIFWTLLTGLSAAVIYYVSIFFGGMNLLLCMILGGLFSFYFCSLCLR